MRYIIPFILLLYIVFGCKSKPLKGETIFTLSKNTAKNANKRKKEESSLVVFDSHEFDFGEIDEGEIIKHVYRFQNTADVPLRILHAKASCGCTLVQKPEEEILPNEFGEIKIEFNSTGKKFKIVKSIRLTTNLNTKSEILYLKGYVNFTKNN